VFSFEEMFYGFSCSFYLSKAENSERLYFG